MFEKYKRTGIAEMRPVTEDDFMNFHNTTEVFETLVDGEKIKISISQADLKNGSPLLGDMVARNPENHKDQWLVAKEYFDANFELAKCK